jgi:RNA polymerase sigma-70 factor (sigma-E family)
MSVLGERAILERTAVRKRDEEVAALFDASYSKLRGLAYVMLGDGAGAEEVVMEAFAKTFSGWNRFRSVDHPDAYMRQVVVNLCRARFRRQKVEHRVNAIVHREPPSASPDLDARFDLWAAVRLLPERQRACVVLRYLEDRPEAEIADILDCSVGTVKSQLFKARAKLEKSLGDEGTRGGRL